MDLSNLRTSLREDEASTLRSARHLRASEDELSAVFRSAATSLTTLYRQGVASNKTSYEKGYAHALAHVLELWDKDRDWLKGYLQRRIEALEVEGEDADEEVVSTTATTPAPVRVRAERQSVKRSRSRSRSDFGAGAGGVEEEENAAERRLHKLPTSAKPSSSSSSSSAFNNSTGFNFSVPLAYPPHSVSSKPPSSSTSNHKNNSSGTSPTTGGVIRTSNAAISRRRLQRLKGLRAGRDRVVEIERPQDEMIDQGAENYDDPTAWTDEDDNNPPPRAKKVVAWTEKSSTNTPALASSTGAGSMDVDHPEAKVLERADRRKRRKSSRKELVESHNNLEHDDAELSRSLDENDVLAYHL